MVTRGHGGRVTGGVGREIRGLKRAQKDPLEVLIRRKLIRDTNSKRHGI